MHPKAMRQQAETMRYAGHSIREVELALGVSRSTASLWLRDAPVSEDGKLRLKSRFDAKCAALAGHARRLVLRHQAARTAAYDAGRSSELTPEDALCIGLYWGEGTKSTGAWEVTNSDRDIIRASIQWAIRAGQPEMAFIAQVQVHPNDAVTDDDVRAYWAQAGIPVERITVRRLRTPTSQMRAKNRLPYGTCRVCPKKNAARLFAYWQGQLDQLIRRAGRPDFPVRDRRRGRPRFDSAPVPPAGVIVT